MKRIHVVFLLFLTGLLGGCSDNNSAGDHVWKDQTDTIEKAKQAEDQIMDAAKLQREAIDDSE